MAGRPATQVREGGTGATRTRFASGVGADGDVELSAPNEVADHRDIDRYFDGGVDSVVVAPWAQANIYPSYYDGHWRDLPVVDVDPRGMRRTQKRIFKKHLLRTAAGGESDGGDIPWVVVFGGEAYVIDGHHRVAHAVHNGRPTIPVHIVDLDS